MTAAGLPSSQRHGLTLPQSKHHSQLLQRCARSNLGGKYVHQTRTTPKESSLAPTADPAASSLSPHIPMDLIIHANASYGAPVLLPANSLPSSSLSQVCYMPDPNRMFTTRACTDSLHAYPPDGRLKCTQNPKTSAHAHLSSCPSHHTMSTCVQSTHAHTHQPPPGPG